MNGEQARQIASAAEVLQSAARQYAASEPDQANSTLLESALRRALLFFEDTGDGRMPTLTSDSTTLVPVFTYPSLLSAWLTATRPDTSAGEIAYAALPGRLLLERYLPNEVGLLLDAGSQHQIVIPCGQPITTNTMPQEGSHA